MKIFTLPVKKAAILSLFFSLCLQQSYGQLGAGTYTVGAGYSYTNLAAVATALGSGISGNVVFELQSNYTEGSSPGVTFSTWSGNTIYTVTIRPAAGVSSMLVDSGGPASYVSLINLSGAQNMILDGRPGGTGTSVMWTIENTQASGGGAAVEMTGGANNNTLQYLNLKSTDEDGFGGTVYLYCSSSGPDNTGDIIQNCDMGTYTGVNYYHANGIGAFGYGPSSGSTPVYGNNNISVLNNTIHDFFSELEIDGCGIKVSGSGNNPDYGHGWTISGNSFFRTINAAQDGTTLMGIDFEPSPDGAGSTGNVISNNYIGGNASALINNMINGTWVTTANTGNSLPAIIGINIEAQSATVSGNVIGGIFDFLVNEENGIVGIYAASTNASGNYVISNNIIGSTHGAGNQYWGTSSSSLTLGSGSKTLTTQTGMGYQAGDTVRISTANALLGYYSGMMEGSVTSYNSTSGSLVVNVYRYLYSGTSTQWNITLAAGIYSAGQSTMDGIWTSVGGSACSITGNTVANLYNVGGNSYTTTGIIAQDGAYTITGNSVYNLANQNPTYQPGFYAEGVYGSVVGISLQSAVSAVQTVSNNVVYNLYSLLSGSNTNNITGIELNGSAGYANVANANFVHSLSSLNAGTGVRLYGIYMYSGAYELTNNMIRLGIRTNETSITGSADMEGITDGESGSNSITQKVYHNTIYIGGTSVISGAVNTYCFFRNNASSPKDILDLRNNIFVNDRSNINGTAKHYGIGLDNNSTVTTDYNDVFGNGTGYNFGTISGIAYAAQSNWTGANAAFDVNSKNGDPLLLNPADTIPDFHLSAGTPCDAVSGATALYPTDYYGYIRANYTPVDLGAVVYGAGSAPPPLASFSSSDTAFCINNCINFTDLSTNSPSGWQWAFAGGSPSSSTSQNPQNICYANVGNYAVMLVVTNAGGTDTLTLDNFISVDSTPTTPVIHPSNDTLFCSHDSSYVSYQWFIGSASISGATDSFLVATNVGDYSVQVTNAGGCTSEGSFDIILGVQDQTAKGSNDNILSLSPNPAWSELKIKNSGFAIEKIGIYNILGENILSPLLKTQNDGDEIVVDVSALPAGIYFVRVANDENSGVAKFTKAANGN